MLCQRCHKNAASVRYAEVVDGRVTELHLCQDCLAHHNTETQTGFELSDPVPSLKKAVAARFAERANEPQGTCAACETSLKTVLRTAKVGCSVCYESFTEDQLRPIFEDVHIGMVHRGKVPHVDDDRAQLRALLQTKRGLLKTILGMEKYEEAATLRDEIRELELSLSMGGEDGERNN